MADVSERLYGVICKYCANCENRKCLADVPWYCASIHCKYFAEEKAEPQGKRKRPQSMKQILKRTLVETF